MKRSIIIAVVLVAIGAAAYSYMRRDGAAANASADTRGNQGGRGGGGGGFGGGGFGGFGGFGGGPRLPMTVEVGQVKRADLTSKLTVVSRSELNPGFSDSAFLRLTTVNPIPIVNTNAQPPEAQRAPASGDEPPASGHARWRRRVVPAPAGHLRVRRRAPMR